MPSADYYGVVAAPRPVLSFPGVPKSDTSGQVSLSYGAKAPQNTGTGGLFDTSWIGSALGLSFGTPVTSSGQTGSRQSVGSTVTTGSLDGSAGFTDILKGGVGAILAGMGAQNDQPKIVPVTYTERGTEGSSMLPIVLLGGAALIAGTYFLAR